MGIISKKRIFIVGLTTFFFLLIEGCQNKKYDEIDAIKRSQSVENIVLSNIRQDSLLILETSNKLLSDFPDSPNAQIRAYWGRANYLGKNDKLDEALKTAKQALEISEKYNLKREQVHSLIILAGIAQDLKNINDMISYIQQAEEIIAILQSDDGLLWAKFYEVYGLYYHELQRHDKAIEYFEKMLAVAQNDKLHFQEAQAYFYIAWIYGEIEKYERCNIPIENATNIMLKYFPYEAADMFYDKSLIMLYQKKNDEAEIAILEAQKLFKKYNYLTSENQGVIFNVLGDISQNRGLYNEALILYNKAKTLLKKPINIKYLYSSLLRHYQVTKNHKAALDIQQKYISIKDSLFSIELALKSTDFEHKYRLSLVEKKHLSETQRIRNIIIYVSICSVILLLIATFLVRYNALKANLAKKEAELKNVEVELKERKLATNTLLINQQNQLLSNIIQKLEYLQHSQNMTEIQKELTDVVKYIKRNKQDENEWDNFKIHFEAVSPKFFDTLKKKYPNLTELDLKHCAYIKINFTTKQVANLLGISPKSVSLFRVRLKKKFNLTEEMPLHDFLREI